MPRHGIRPLTTLDECRAVAALERTVWGYTDAEDVVPPPVLIVSIKRGGILLGAFDDGGDHAGFVYSMPAHQGRARDTVVAHARRDSGRAGRGARARLKLAQREAAIEMGLDLIEWTFDPLQALNAHLNFAKLGVVVEEYEENIYGESSSPLHRGTPTDRFVAEWRITRAARRAADRGAPRSIGCATPRSRTRRSSILPRKPSRGFALARRISLQMHAGCWWRFRLALPRCWSAIASWRRSGGSRPGGFSRHYFARGYRAVDFFLARGAGKGRGTSWRSRPG